MKKLSLYRLHWLIFSIVMMLTACKEEPLNFHLSDFQNPQETAGIYTWWHWMDKAITREGITRDLESMKEQGIVAVTLLNVGLFGGQDLGVRQVPFDSPEWYDMFRFALEEADRLGLVMGIHNCDGWSTSGGPWITPENSMKHYVWSHTGVTGGKPISLRLNQPVGKMDFYRDVAVFAYPSTYNFRQGEAIPEILINDAVDGSVLCDGEPMSYLEISVGDRIQFNFSREETIEKVAIHPHLFTQWGGRTLSSVFDIEVSEDGKTYRRHASLQVTMLNQTTFLSFPAIKARYFRVVPREIKGPGGSGKVLISEVELLGKNEFPRYRPSVSNHLKKTTAVHLQNMAEMVEVEVHQVNAPAIDPGSVIDLTGYGFL